MIFRKQYQGFTHYCNFKVIISFLNTLPKLYVGTLVQKISFFVTMYIMHKQSY